MVLIHVILRNIQRKLAQAYAYKSIPQYLLCDSKLGIQTRACWMQTSISRRINTLCPMLCLTCPIHTHSAGLTNSNHLLCQPSIVRFSSDSDKNVTYEEIIKLKMKKAVILIDVREPHEIAETGKLPGSLHIPLNEVTSTLGSMSDKEFQLKYGEQKPSKDAPLVFSCKAGNRSKIAMENVQKIGFTNARSYGGGFVDWTEKTKK